MGTNKKPRKKYVPKPKSLYEEKRFLYTEEDSKLMSINLFLRLSCLVRGIGTHADKTSIRIRLIAGMRLLKECFVMDDTTKELEMKLVCGLDSIMRHTTKVSEDKQYILASEAFPAVQEALVISDQLIAQSSFTQEVLAYKYAEDEVLVGADQYEYVVLGTV